MEKDLQQIYQSPQAELNVPKQVGEHGSIEKALAGEYKIDIGEIIGEAFDKTDGAKWTFVKVFLIWFLTVLTLTLPFEFATPYIIKNFSQNEFAIYGIAFINQLIQTAIFTPLGVAIWMIGLRRSLDIDIGPKILFRYFNKAGPLLIMVLMQYFMIIIGLICLVLPGIYLMFAYTLSAMLMVDKDMGPWEAMETSRKAITKQWWTFFIFFIFMGVLVLLSALPLGIGLLWTLPISTIAMGIIYRDMFGYEAHSVSD